MSNLRDEVRALFLEIDANAAPTTELTIRAIEEEWDEDRFREETVELIRSHQLDLRKNFDYYTDKVMSLFEKYAKETA